MAGTFANLMRDHSSLSMRRDAFWLHFTNGDYKVQTRRELTEAMTLPAALRGDTPDTAFLLVV